MTLVVGDFEIYLLVHFPMCRQVYDGFSVTLPHPARLDQVRGSCWVISKKVRNDADSAQATQWLDSCQLLMMTSATLIEALYEAVDEWLQERSKSNLTELSSEERHRVTNMRGFS